MEILLFLDTIQFFRKELKIAYSLYLRSYIEFADKAVIEKGGGDSEKCLSLIQMI